MPEAAPPPIDAGAGRRWRDRLPFLLLLGLAFLIGCFPEADYDIWWHLRTGELIPEKGVPRTDWYSFTSPDRPWIDVHWGFQRLVAAVHSRWGFEGLTVLKAATAVVVLAIALTAYRREWPAFAQLLGWIPAFLLVSSRLYIRPEIFTLVYTAGFLSILLNAERRPAFLWLLPVLQVFWSNTQGLFVFGPILMGMYGVELLARRLTLPKDASPPGFFNKVVVVGLLVGAACLVSPYGVGNIDLVQAIWAKMGSDSDGKLYKENIAELTDVRDFLSRGGSTNPYVWILFGLLAAGLVSIVVRGREIVAERRLFAVLPLAAFGWLSLQATRNGNHFALVAGVMIAWNFGAAFGSRATKTAGKTPARSGGMGVAVQCGLVIAVAYLVASGWWYRQVGGHRAFGFGLRPGAHALEAMKLAGRASKSDRAAAFHIGHAATYIYANGPEKKILMDPRLEVHSEGVFREYLRIEDDLTKKGGDAGLRGYDVGVVVAGSEHNHRIQAALFGRPNAWRCVHYDEI
ncbi:MAG: hypothetical protein ACRDD1_19145, partial [Planctomycetia bacterium]